MQVDLLRNYITCECYFIASGRGRHM